MVYLLPLLCFVIPLIAGAVLVRAGRGVIVAVLVLLLAGLLGWTIWRGQQATGMDGLGYAIMAMLMCAPGILGLLVGSAVGWWQRRKGPRG
ncbi:MAG: hypothetical protein RIA08_15915 [Roseovarius sp.]|uniref:hypothetical protein n=1 Tax=Roseobacteraceae TaxID=2854170 RepID=UPI0032EFE880